MQPVAISGYQCVTSAGSDHSALLAALIDNQPRLAPLQLFSIPFATVVGEVTHELPEVRESLKHYGCRNAQLALAALSDDFRELIAACVERYGANRIGVVIGTSTSGIYNSESAYRYFIEHRSMPDNFRFMHRHFVHATGEFVAHELGLQGPCYAISTACSTSAKTLAAGQRLIQSGVCDAVLAGGVDTLCQLTLFGFNSLELVSEQQCKPMDANRNGINIGEAAALVLLEAVNDTNQSSIRLLGVGESCDAHHMSAPHPQGKGAVLAMQAALTLSGIKAQQVDYVCLHATATPLNDLSEAQAVQHIFGTETPCSGLKGLLGHTLGASGTLEVIATMLAMQNEVLPGTCGLTEQDSDIHINMMKNPQRHQRIRYSMSNAFGFGGNNASVLLALPG
ncbi:MAG: beta-ketoacyl-ACP synthase [Gammaproteobacteria bacterium]|nr:beta-ketoacyl-ACP synthase [Gammaproteobacteria bacterium]